MLFFFSAEYLLISIKNVLTHQIQSVIFYSISTLDLRTNWFWIHVRQVLGKKKLSWLMMSSQKRCLKCRLNWPLNPLVMEKKKTKIMNLRFLLTKSSWLGTYVCLTLKRLRIWDTLQVFAFSTLIQIKTILKILMYGFF